MSTNTESAPPAQWRSVLKVHPVADAFPLLSEKELKVLAGDIERNGLKTPIILWAPEEGAEFQLLDGRNRLDALEMLGRIVVDDGRLQEGIGWEAAFGGDPKKLAYSLNVYRRHLTAERKRELIEALIKDDPSKSDRLISKEVGASPTFVGKVRAEKEATGDVSTVDTRTDTKGRQQPARKAPKAKAPKSDADEEEPEQAESPPPAPVAVAAANGSPLVATAVATTTGAGAPLTVNHSNGNNVDPEASGMMVKEKFAAIEADEADEPEGEPDTDEADLADDDEGETSTGALVNPETEMLTRRLEEVLAENRRLRDERDELRAEVERLRGELLAIPAFLQRGPDNKAPFRA
jgi:hypothetical protein